MKIDQLPEDILNICVGGDLDGKTFKLNKGGFKANDLEKGKFSEYRRRRFITGHVEYKF